MTRSEFLFKIIDVLFHPGQNYRRYPGIVQEKPFVYDKKRPHACTAEYFYDPKLLESGAKLPVVLNIHGGGFVKGDKKHRKSLCKRFAKHGYFTMNINYGLGPKDPYPQGVIDCMNALNYLVKTAEKYNIDLNRVCVTGDSAGAYCATYLVAMAANPDLCVKIGAPQCVVKPALLVSFCGPYDLLAALELTKLPFNLVWDIGRCYLGKDFGLKKDFSNLKEYKYIKEIGPIELVNADWCPSFLVMSEKDIFCKGQGEILKGKLKEVGVEADTFSSHKFLDNHCFHLDFWKKISKECFAKAFAFMAAHLKKVDLPPVETLEDDTPVIKTPVAEEKTDVEPIVEEPVVSVEPVTEEPVTETVTDEEAVEAIAEEAVVTEEPVAEENTAEVEETVTEEAEEVVEAVEEAETEEAATEAEEEEAEEISEEATEESEEVVEEAVEEGTEEILEEAAEEAEEETTEEAAEEEAVEEEAEEEAEEAAETDEEPEIAEEVVAEEAVEDTEDATEAGEETASEESANEEE